MRTERESKNGEKISNIILKIIFWLKSAVAFFIEWSLLVESKMFYMPYEVHQGSWYTTNCNTHSSHMYEIKGCVVVAEKNGLTKKTSSV